MSSYTVRYHNPLFGTLQIIRTGITTHPIVSTTPRGEIHLHSSAALGRHLFLSREKALSLAQALITEAAGGNS